MIDGLDTRNDVHQSGIVVVDMFNEFSLRVRWAGNENGAHARHRLDDLMKKVLVLRCMSAADAIRFVMDMPGRVLGMQDQPIDVIAPKLKYAGLKVVDPDDRVVVTSHVVLPCVRGISWLSHEGLARQMIHIKIGYSGRSRGAIWRPVKNLLREIQQAEVSS
jgi:hypothetical protein